MTSALWLLPARTAAASVHGPGPPESPGQRPLTPQNSPSRFHTYEELKAAIIWGGFVHLMNTPLGWALTGLWALPRRNAESMGHRRGPTAAEWVCSSLTPSAGGEGLALSQAAGLVPGVGAGAPGVTLWPQTLFLSAWAGLTLGKDGRTSLLLPGGAQRPQVLPRGDTAMQAP